MENIKTTIGDINNVLISIFSLNVWGLPSLVTKNKYERMHAIGKHLKNENFDVICLQEVWSQDDFNLLKNYLCESYKYFHYFYSGVVGSGLCIFSKWPIYDTMYHQWPLNGYIHMVHHGDWFGGKGVGLAVLNINGYMVNIYTTHLHAQYSMDNDFYLAHRVAQALDTALFIKLTSGNSDLAVLAGDLNSEPGSLCERLIQFVTRFQDSYSAHDEESVIGTNECSRNSFSSNFAKTKPQGLRIDYILYNNGPNAIVDILSYFFPLSAKVPNEKFSFSDHEAIAAKFSLSRGKDNSLKPVLIDGSNFEATLNESISVCSSALEQVKWNSLFYWTLAISLGLSIFLTPIFIEFPLVHSSFYYTLLVASVIFMVMSVLMATLWCKMEQNGIIAVKNRMVLLLERLKEC